MQQELVTVATYSRALEAEAARNFLEASGIRSFVADENFAVTMWSNLAETKLQVAAADAEQAKELLAEHHAGDNLIGDAGEESGSEKE